MEEEIKKILMNRDGLTETEAQDLILDAKSDLHNKLAKGEMPFDICQEYFGLEPDYIMELI